MTDLESKINDLDARVDKIEQAIAVTGEQIRGLVKSVDRLTHVTTFFAFLLLLTVIYGAVGASGFRAVTSVPITSQK